MLRLILSIHNARRQGPSLFTRNAHNSLNMTLYIKFVMKEIYDTSTSLNYTWLW